MVNSILVWLVNGWWGKQKIKTKNDFLVGFFGDTSWNLPPKSATLCMPKLAESESPEITFVLGVYAKKWYDRKILPKNNGWCVIFNNQDIEHANV